MSASFSIITPTLNAATTIKCCIESVIAANRSGITVEHLIIDGGSTDETVEIARKHSSVRVYSEPDEGIFDAMNRGLQRADGEIIGILNADDWYEPGSLDLVSEVFRQNPEVMLVHGDQYYWTNSSEPVFQPPHLEWLKGWRRYLGMPLRHPTVFVRSELYSRIGTFDASLRLSADYDFILRCLRHNVPMTYIPRPLANMRSGGAGNRHAAFWEKVRLRRQAGLPLIIGIPLTFIITSRQKGLKRTLWSLIANQKLSSHAPSKSDFLA